MRSLSRHVAVLNAVAVMSGACAMLRNPNKVPDPTIRATVVNVSPDRQWTDTGLEVKKGDSFFFTATGEVQWEARGKTAGADGVDGSRDWRLGPGALIGRIDESRPFEIGARVGMFRQRHVRPPHHPFPPPPLEMPRDGRLFLGFKDFTPGRNHGGFEVTIRSEK